MTRRVTADELREAAEELDLDVIGAAPAGPYEDTERHILERRARGLFGLMRFTMARPGVSCHPETLLDGARTVISAALCYWTDGPEPGPTEGRVARYAWRDHYALLRERLDALGVVSTSTSVTSVPSTTHDPCVRVMSIVFLPMNPTPERSAPARST